MRDRTLDACVGTPCCTLAKEALMRTRWATEFGWGNEFGTRESAGSSPRPPTIRVAVTRSIPTAWATSPTKERGVAADVEIATAAVRTDECVVLSCALETLRKS
jgi:hypothetical protein